MQETAIYEEVKAELKIDPEQQCESKFRLDAILWEARNGGR